MSEDWVDLPFDEAVAYLMAQRPITKEAYDAMSLEERSTAFTASRVYKLDILQQMLDRLNEAITNGMTIDEFVLDFADVGLSEGHLETIFRTNLQSAYGRGSWDQLTDSDISDLIWGWRYHTVGDDRVREEHEALDGMEFELGQGDAVYPPWDFNCATGEALVSGKITGAFRRLYRGKILEISTRGGRRLRITPNHPVLTATGFVAARTLRQGLDVLSYRGWPEDFGAPDQDKHDAPARIDEVFRSLPNLLDGFARVSGVPVRELDFHGDSMAGYRNVDVVLPKRELLLGLKAAGAESLRYLSLVSVDVGQSGLASPGCSNKSLKRNLAAASGLPRGGQLPPNGRLAHARPLDNLSLGPASKINASRSEPSGNERSRDAEFIGELLDGYPGLVAPDQIVEIREFDFWPRLRPPNQRVLCIRWHLHKQLPMFA